MVVKQVLNDNKIPILTYQFGCYPPKLIKVVVYGVSLNGSQQSVDYNS